ncbi:MAG: hypothetical protein EPN45_13400 [Rhizobiaceae bacterium]|nr:MAG: hypothetical protein EPN45_13400 [Rhizobiaceae bacterium]
MQMPIMAKDVFIAGFIALAPFRVKPFSECPVLAPPPRRIIKILFNMEQNRVQSPSKEDEKAKFQSHSITI